MTRSCNISLGRSVILVQIFNFLCKSAEMLVILNLFYLNLIHLIMSHTENYYL